MKDVPDAKVELANAKEVLHVLKGRASADRLPLRSAIEERDRAQNGVGTLLSKLQVT